MSKNKAQLEVDKIMKDNNLSFNYQFRELTHGSYISNISFIENKFTIADIFSKIKIYETVVFVLSDGSRIINKQHNYNPKYDASIYWENETHGDFIRIGILDDNGVYISNDYILSIIDICKRENTIDSLLDKI